MTEIIEGEVWKDVAGYEGVYEISSLGRIKSIKRSGTKGGFMSVRNSNMGYPMVYLKSKGKAKNCTVHRLLAIAFLERVEGKDFVNHIDGNKENNDIENLEWVSRSENQIHAYKKGLQKINICSAHEVAWENKRMKVEQYTIDGIFVDEFKSLTEAAEKTKGHTSSISLCANGKAEHAGGYIWKFKKTQELSRF